MPALLARSVVAILAAVLAAFSVTAHAQSYPSRPLTMIVLLAPGTGLDVIARSYGEKLSQALGRPVVAENKPGGAGVVATNALMAAPADGHTMVVLTSGALSINPAVFKKLPYDVPRDFIPISVYLKSPFILVVTPSLPAKNVAELVTWLRENKGKASYSSPGIAGAPHLAGEMFAQLYNLDVTHVPYKSSPQGIADVAAGVVQFAFAEAGASQALIRDGRIRALAVTSTTRLNTLPDVAPFAEVANQPGFEAVSWHALLVRAGTPPDIVNRLHEEMKRIMREPDIQDRMMKIGLIPVESPSVDGIRDFIRSETEKWGGLVKRLGLEGSQ